MNSRSRLRVPRVLATAGLGLALVGVFLVSGGIGATGKGGPAKCGKHTRCTVTTTTTTATASGPVTRTVTERETTTQRSTVSAYGSTRTVPATTVQVLSVEAVEATLVGVVLLRTTVVPTSGTTAITRFVTETVTVPETVTETSTDLVTEQTTVDEIRTWTETETSTDITVVTEYTAIYTSDSSSIDLGGCNTDFSNNC